jgi:hypothetical protein
VKRVYFVNAWVDVAMIGGLSILTLLLLRLLHGAERTPAIYTISTVLLWIGNWPHFSATNYRLYGQMAHLRQYPVTALVLPFVVLAGVAASFASPEVIAPLFIKVSCSGRRTTLVDNRWVLPCCMRAGGGLPISPYQRVCLAGFVFGSFLYPTAQFESGVAGGQFFSIPYPAFGIPAWIATATAVGMWLCGSLFLLTLGAWCYRTKKRLPPIILLPAVTQYCWFVAGAGWASFTEFVPFFHGLQYLLIAWAVQLKDKQEQRGMTPCKSYVLTETCRWGLLNVLGGAALFVVLPRVGVYAGWSLGFSLGVVHAAVQLHHFIVDGVIWKLSQTRVSRPLMMTISDVFGATRAATADVWRCSP